MITPSPGKEPPTTRIPAIVIMAIFAAPVCYFLYAESTRTPYREAVADVRAQTRAAQWARVGRESTLGADETLREVRIPDPISPGSEQLDQVCYLYTHHKYQISTLSCSSLDLAYVPE